MYLPDGTVLSRHSYPLHESGTGRMIAVLEEAEIQRLLRSGCARLVGTRGRVYCVQLVVPTEHAFAIPEAHVFASIVKRPRDGERYTRRIDGRHEHRVGAILQAGRGAFHAVPVTVAQQVRLERRAR